MTPQDAVSSAISIISPISEAEEVDPLVDAGATEFYCGVMPTEWSDRHGAAAWLNRRGSGKANLASLQDFARLLERAHARGCSVKVAMNAPAFVGPQLEDALVFCKALQGSGADGLIVSDVALLLELQAAGIRIPITLSSVASVHSAEACRFFLRCGVSSIVLPRHVSLHEMQALRAALPELKLEVFVLNDGCVYEEGHCATTHTLGAFCSTPWEPRFARVDGGPLSPEEQTLLQTNFEHYKEWTWYTNDCGCSYSPRGLPNGPCGLCSLWSLAQMGVRAFKIVGREAHPFRKLRSVQLVRAIVDQIEAGEASEACQTAAIELRGTPELCASGYMCYYREGSTVARATLQSVSGPHA